METTSDTHVPYHADPIKSDTARRRVNIPIWVMDNVPYSGTAATRPSCPVDDILMDGGIFWFSVNELTKSNLLP
jgi:hypothetical protein